MLFLATVVGGAAVERHCRGQGVSAPAASLALEKGPAGSHWHAVEDGGIPFREIAEAIGSRLGLLAVSIPETN